MQKGISYFFLTCVFFFFPKTFSQNFISNDTNDRGAVIKSFFYVYITCFGIQVEKCSRKLVEKCLYSQYEQETRIKGRGREHLLWDSEAKKQNKTKQDTRTRLL